jgi:hypothetical protein
MRRVAVLIALLTVVAVAFAAPAGAVNLTGGCEGSAVSLSEDGDEVMAFSAPSDEPGTKGNPVLVDYDGTVLYEGSGPVMLDNSWSIKVGGVPVKSDGDDNSGGDSTTEGVAEVADYLPFEVTGLFYVEGEISGEGGECAGNGYVKLIGSPIGTVPWIAALGLIVVGLALGFFAFPKAVAASTLPAMSLPPDDVPSAPPPPSSSPPPPPPPGPSDGSLT